jgi:hypothetical protein
MIKRNKQRGVALLVAILLVLLLSVIGISLAFVAQAETWSSLNYRIMTQERYGAEAGMNAAAYYLMDTYTAPATTGTDLLSNYTMTTSPVQYNGHPVVLSTTTSAANYPVAAVETAFAAAAHGSLTAGTSTLNYTASATLLAMHQVTTASGAVTVQTWSITADDPITGIRTGDEEVTGVLERQVSWGAVSAPGYGVFATGTVCEAINLSGNPLIASYSSAKPLVSGAVQVNNFGGDVGTNGNLTAAGSSTVEGTLSTPRAGIETGKKAACSGAAVNAGDYTGTSTVTGCATAGPVAPATTCTSTPVELSQNITYTAPTMPGSQPTFNAAAGITVGNATTCASLGLATGCTTVSPGNLIFTPAAYPNGNFPALTVNSTGSLQLNPGTGTFTFNGITQSNGGQITIDASSAMTVNTTSLTTSGSKTFTIENSAPLTLNVWGNSSGTGVDLTTGTALTMNGSSVVTMNIASTTTAPFTASGAWNNTNSTGVPTPAMFLINYGGTSAITVEAGSAAAAAIYAPNSPISITGGSTFYGSLIGSTVSDTNGANIYYDTQLGGNPSATQIATVGNFMLDSFSWARF